MALIVSFLVFPYFATSDVKNRIHYCFLNLHRMQTFVLEAFSSEDPAAAKIALARASIVERRLGQAITPMRTRLEEADYEPSGVLNTLLSRRRKFPIGISLKSCSIFNSIDFYVAFFIVLFQCK